MTDTERLIAAADGIRQVAEQFQGDPEKARELLIALAANVTWIAEGLE